jgi:hypothetical protein
MLDFHRAKLKDIKGFAILSRPFLFKNDWPAVF